MGSKFPLLKQPYVMTLSLQRFESSCLLLLRASNGWRRLRTLEQWLSSRFTRASNWCYSFCRLWVKCLVKISKNVSHQIHLVSIVAHHECFSPYRGSNWWFQPTPLIKSEWKSVMMKFATEWKSNFHAPKHQPANDLGTNSEESCEMIIMIHRNGLSSTFHNNAAERVGLLSRGHGDYSVELWVLFGKSIGAGLICHLPFASTCCYSYLYLYKFI